MTVAPRDADGPGKTGTGEGKNEAVIHDKILPVIDKVCSGGPPGRAVDASFPAWLITFCFAKCQSGDLSLVFHSPCQAAAEVESTHDLQALQLLQQGFQALRLSNPALGEQIVAQFSLRSNQA